jgi:hypothetical protein
LDSQFIQGVLHFLQFERLDDRLDLFHVSSGGLPFSSTAGASKPRRCSRTGFQPVSNASGCGPIFTSSVVPRRHQTVWFPGCGSGQAGSPSYHDPVQRRTSGDCIVPAKGRHARSGECADDATGVFNSATLFYEPVSCLNV